MGGPCEHRNVVTLADERLLVYQEELRDVKLVTQEILKCHNGSTRSDQGKSMRDLWWTKWHWDRLFSNYVGFPVTVPLHQLYTFIHLSPIRYNLSY